MIMGASRFFFLYFIFVSLASSYHGQDQDNFEANISQLKEELRQHMNKVEAELSRKFDQRQQDLENRVAKLEELIRIGTLRSCAEYSQYGIKTDGFYMIDPDGPLLGHPPFQVFCNFTSGQMRKLCHKII